MDRSYQDTIHKAIDTAIIIQKNCKNFLTDIGVVLNGLSFTLKMEIYFNFLVPVKIAISVGEIYFCLVGKKDLFVHYILVGQPMWNVKAGEKLTQPGEIMVTVKAMAYVNSSLYESTVFENKRYFKIWGFKDSFGSIQRQHGY